MTTLALGALLGSTGCGTFVVAPYAPNTNLVSEIGVDAALAQVEAHVRQSTWAIDDSLLFTFSPEINTLSFYTPKHPNLPRGYTTGFPFRQLHAQVVRRERTYAITLTHVWNAHGHTTSYPEEPTERMWWFQKPVRVEAKSPEQSERWAKRFVDLLMSLARTAQQTGLTRAPRKPEAVAAAPRPAPAPAPVAPPKPAGPLDYGACHALVIGNNDYEHMPKLKTAQHDAAVVASVLRDDYGYSVTLLENGSRAQIVSALSKLRRTLQATDNLLVYYAGHGYLDKEAAEGYWLPVDARKDDEGQWISNATITTRLRTIPAKHVMVVSDSCYSGSLTRGLTIKVRDQNHYSKASGRKARVVLTSGGLEPVEDAGGQGHSVFANRFLSALRGNPGVMDGTALAKQVRETVMMDADQEPSYGVIRKCGHDEGDYLFVRKR